MPRIPGITRLGVRCVVVTMAQPHNTASGVVGESPLVLIDIEADDGSIGHGLLFTYTRAALKPTAELLRNLEPLLIGEALTPAELALKLARRFRLLGTQGLVGMALAGIDMALWDASARHHDVTLTNLLGGAQKPIRAYGAVGFDGETGSAAAAEDWVKRGFTGIKAKIGYPSLSEDLAVVRAMRRAVGDDVAIMVDYNQSLTPSQAVVRLRALDDEGLVWIEEPTLAHDFDGHAHVARTIATPIQSGENWWGPLDFRHAIEARASDYLMPDVMKVGGVSGWMKVAAMAEVHGLPVSSHLWPEISAQLLCLTPTAHWLEYADWWNPVLAEPLRIENGFAHVQDTAGSGVAWNEDRVAAFCV